MQSKYKSRKLIITIVLSVLATVFMLMDMANFDQWANFQQWIFGIYASGNVGEHAVNKFRNEKRNDEGSK